MNARLVDFLCTALRFAQTSGAEHAQRLADSPFSGLPRDDARAFAAVASTAQSLGDAITSRRLALSSEAAYAAAEFAHALDRVQALAALPSESAQTLVATIVAAFELDARCTDDERRTLDAIRAEARACDAEAAGCTPLSLARRLEAGLGRPARVAPPPPKPLAVCERQSQRPVRRRTKHFSASSLEMYAECPRKWFYRYTCATVDDPGSPASFYGTAFHWALEQFHAEVVRDTGAPAEALEAKLIGWVNTAFERYRAAFGTSVEFELHRRRATRTAKRYVRWFLERSAAEPFTVAGTEVEVELELEGYRFIGFIDRLDRTDGSGALNVLDYKTGKIAEHASAYREEIAKFVEFQLPFYYWSQAAKGERVSKLALVPLRDGYGSIVPVELEVVPISAPRSPRDRAQRGVIGIDELERARSKMIEIAGTLSEERITRFNVTSDAEACTYCVYRPACRERPAAEAPKFSR
jgi:RecB family exonuclease